MAEAKFLNRALRYQRRLKDPGRRVHRGPTTHYIWRVDPVYASRTRSSHRALNGRMFSWDEPPIVDYRTGERGHPGLDQHCRCWAEPVPDEPPSPPRKIDADADADPRTGKQTTGDAPKEGPES